MPRILVIDDDPTVISVPKHRDDREKRPVVLTNHALVDHTGRPRPPEVPHGACDACLEVTQHLGEPVGRQANRVLQAGEARLAGRSRVFTSRDPQSRRWRARHLEICTAYFMASK